LAFLHYIFRKYILQLTDSPDKLKNYSLWNFLFFVSQGIITILIVPVAGVLLAYGFLMIPAAIGLLFSKRWIPAMIIGWSAGMISCLLGIVFSYYTDSPYGPSLLLAMGLFFMIALFIHVITSQSKNK
jgi:zinc/manganese transport system permease protein